MNKMSLGETLKSQEGTSHTIVESFGPDGKTAMSPVPPSGDIVHVVRNNEEQKYYVYRKSGKSSGVKFNALPEDAKQYVNYCNDKHYYVEHTVPYWHMSGPQYNPFGTTTILIFSTAYGENSGNSEGSEAPAMNMALAGALKVQSLGFSRPKDELLWAFWAPEINHLVLSTVQYPEPRCFRVKNLALEVPDLYYVLWDCSRCGARSRAEISRAKAIISYSVCHYSAAGSDMRELVTTDKQFTTYIYVNHHRTTISEIPLSSPPEELSFEEALHGISTVVTPILVSAADVSSVNDIKGSFMEMRDEYDVSHAIDYIIVYKDIGLLVLMRHSCEYEEVFADDDISHYSAYVCNTIERYVQYGQAYKITGAGAKVTPREGGQECIKQCDCLLLTQGILPASLREDDDPSVPLRSLELLTSEEAADFLRKVNLNPKFVFAGKHESGDKLQELFPYTENSFFDRKPYYLV